MPSFVTHSYFMQDIYDKLDSKIDKLGSEVENIEQGAEDLEGSV